MTPVRSVFAAFLAMLACVSAVHSQVAAPALPGAGSPSGVTLATLHNFVPVAWANSSALIQGGDGNFYGTTGQGGAYGFGAVYQLTSSGSLNTLYSFTGASDGGDPLGPLVQGSDGNFYGTTQQGGSSNAGTVFQLTSSGSLATLYAFTGGGDGASPNALVQGADGNFYGTTGAGGGDGDGTVFQITSAGSLTTLYSFSALSGGVNPDGAYPSAGLIQGADGNFYGTSNSGGLNGQGTVFEIGSSGSFTSLYSFTGGNDGAQPVAGVIQGSDGNFYGTTQSGGADGWGTVFQLAASGTSSTLNTVYTFTGGSDGGAPNAVVQGNDGNLYGTAQYSGAGNAGIVFQVTTGGTFATLYAFSGGNDGANPQTGLIQGGDGNFYGATSGGGLYGDGTVFQVSSGGALATLFSGFPTTDGANPAGLVQGSDGNFYGTTQNGGGFGAGTVFQMTSGGSLSPIYTFTGGIDGANPQAALVEGADGNLYGTTGAGGANGSGAVFQVTFSGSLTTLYSFSPLSGGSNADGADPSAPLVQGADGNFYGTTDGGGVNGQGTVFEIASSGSLTTLYSFTGGNDGAQPYSGVIQGSDGNFYGTTQSGGVNGWGTVFQLVAGGTSSTLNTLYAFTGGNDGGYPNALVQGTDGNFYGTTAGNNGSSSDGTVFQITSSGSLTTLYAFTGANDGGCPQAGLIQGTDGNFYGTTSAGGGWNGGTAFQVTSSGSLTTLYSFTGGNDGANPQAGLIQGSDGNIYGTTFGQAFAAGNTDNGTVFALDLITLPTGPGAIGPVGPVLPVGPIGSVGPIGISPVTISGSADPIWVGAPVWTGPGPVLLSGSQSIISGTYALGVSTPMIDFPSGPGAGDGDSLSTAVTSVAPTDQASDTSATATAPAAGQTLAQGPTPEGADTAPVPRGGAPQTQNIGGGTSAAPADVAASANTAPANNSDALTLSANRNINFGNSVEPPSAGMPQSTFVNAPATPSGNAATVSSDDGAAAINGNETAPEPAASGTDGAAGSSLNSTYTTLALNTASQDSRAYAATPATLPRAERLMNGARYGPNLPAVGGQAAATGLSVGPAIPAGSRASDTQRIPARPVGAGVSKSAAVYHSQFIISSILENASGLDRILTIDPTPAYSAGVAVGTDAALLLTVKSNR